MNLLNAHFSAKAESHNHYVHVANIACMKNGHIGLYVEKVRKVVVCT